MLHTKYSAANALWSLIGILADKTTGKRSRKTTRSREKNVDLWINPTLKPAPILPTSPHLQHRPTIEILV